MKKCVKMLFCLCCLVVLCCSEIRSQQTSKTDSKEIKKKIKEVKKKAELVPLSEISRNVMVLDQNKKLPLTVKAEDLKIFENGVEQKISRLEKRNVYINLGLVIDNSNSLTYRLNEITLLTKTLVQALNQSEEAFVVRFVDSEKIEVIQDWTSDIKQVNEALDNLYTEGGQTALLDAVYLSVGKMLDKNPTDSGKENVILVISDFEERASYYELADLLEVVRNKPVQIYCLAVTKHLDEKKAKRAKELAYGLSLYTGGSAYFFDEDSVKDTKKISRAEEDEEILKTLKDMIYEVRSQYKVIFMPFKTEFDKIPRDFKVQFSGDPNGRTILAHDKFFVSKDFYKAKK